ncbi:MAG: SagB/ThcOx family dehydrogenase [Euryarchaeota archaeon]|nr:SagB/ThcOx family dehydrogenase [Euryarchaeota archaeon]
MRRAVVAILVFIIIASTLVTWAILPHESEPVFMPLSRSAAVEVVALPKPVLKGNVSVEEALQNRRSVREYTDAAISLGELSQLLWAAQGVTNAQGFRTAPSAGALYPLDVYAVNATGVYHYNTQNHSLGRITSTNVQENLTKAALGQSAVRTAPLVLVITGVYERTAAKYGDRAERYVHLEAGHAAQNVLLECAALGLGAVPIGAFDDARVQAALGIPGDHQPLYVIPIGHIS